MANMELGNLIWKITGDTKDFDKSIASTDQKTKGLGKSFQGIGTLAKTFITGVAVKAIVDMGKKLVALSSDAEETQNKFDVVFSSIKSDADSAAKNLAENYGLSSRAAKQLLSDTGDLLTGFGFTQESALELSEQVNTLAVDLASFTNFSGGAEGASAALTKALLGETESLKSLGIAISQADIEQLARDKGVVGEIDRQTKAMLTLELAVKQSKNAIGDFARSQDSFANQSRVLRSNVENLGITIGSVLLPSATAGASALAGVVEVIDNFVSGVIALGDENRYVKALENTGNEAERIIGTLTEKNRLDKVSGEQISSLVELYPELTGKMNENNTTLEEATRLVEEANRKRAESIVKEEIQLQNQYSRSLRTATKDLKENVGMTIEQAAQVFKAKENLERLTRQGQDATKAQQEYNDLLGQFGLWEGNIARMGLLYEQYVFAKQALDESNERTQVAINLSRRFSEEGRKAAEEQKRIAEEEKKKREEQRKREEEQLAAAREYAQALREAESIIDQALESELTERDKILRQIETLTSIKYDDLEQENKRIEALRILKAEYDRLGETAKEVAKDRRGATKEEAQYGHMVAASLFAARSETEELYNVLTDGDAWSTFASNADSAVSAVMDIFSALADLTSQQYDNRLDELDRQLQAELEANGLAEQSAVEKAQAEVDAAIRAGDEEAEAKARLELRKAQIEEEYAEKRKALEYQAALAAWQYRMLDATASAAMAVLNAIASGFAMGGPITAAAFGAAAAIAGGIQVAAIDAARPVMAATGGVIPARPGGTNVIAAENGGNELLLNSAESGRAMMAEFSDQIAARIGGGNGTIHAIIQMPDGKVLADVTAPYFRNGQVRI